MLIGWVVVVAACGGGAAAGGGEAREEGEAPPSRVDSDGDLVFDDRDRCPGEEEDRDGVSDDDGCLDADDDEDGVLDVEDRCPDRRETRNRIEDGDGCPDGETVGESCVAVVVRFGSGSAELTDDAVAVLGRVAETLASTPEIQQVEVRAHTDATERRELAEQRLIAVRAYLLARGVPEAKLVGRAYAGEVPITSNRTEPGRAQNRRVDFRIAAQRYEGEADTHRTCTPLGLVQRLR